MIKLLTAAALLSGQAAAPPAPAPARCVTRQQVSDLTMVGMSIFVGGARRLCRVHLPAGAFLLTPAGERFDASLRTEAERRLDSALGGVERMFPSDGPMVPAVMATMIRSLMTSGPGPELAGLVDADTCGDLNQMIEAMSGMSPQQFGQFTTAAVSLVSRMEERERARRAAAAAADPAPVVVQVPVTEDDPAPAATVPPEPDSPPESEEAPAPPPPPPMPLICPE